MFKKLVVSFAIAGLALASAATHRVTLFEEASVNGQTLKPGDYKLEVTGDKAMLSRGKQKVEAPVSVLKAASKYSSTSVRYNNGEGKFKVQEIRIGGTDTKVVLDATADSAAGGR
ncbi:MAG: hypothetical protein FJW31_01715 [Acidobacteria bacterium]|nr:hypothetical protein [Acidobacteriota bacterium]